MNIAVISVLSVFHIFIIVGVGVCVFLPSKICLVNEINSIWVKSALISLVGGSTYCLRGLYMQYCVKGEWDNRWILWHIIRPVVSTVCGVISLLFVKAGLLLVQASASEDQSYYGTYIIAFMAGLNVDGFMEKIESIFKELVSMKKSRMSSEETKEKAK